MTSTYTICDATPADAKAIASLFSLSWTSPFTQLQFGHVDPPTLAADMTPRIAKHMETPNIRFIVARHDCTQEVASVAQWTLPNYSEGNTNNQETPEEKKERQNFEDEAYKNRLPETSNKNLIMAFTLGLRSLRELTLGSHKTYLLENVATHPEHRGKGLAGQLIEWVFPLADEKGSLVYLDTASDNVAMRLYKRLGFVEEGRSCLEDLSQYVGKEEMERWGVVEHTHVALVRYPKNDA